MTRRGAGSPSPDRRDEIRRELASHIGQRADELREQGYSEEVAFRMAREEFGDTRGVERVLRVIDWRRDLIRRTGGTVAAIVQDIRFALRGFRRQPTFALLAVLTLALGIGATTAIFSVVYGVLLRPLNYRDPGRIVTVWATPRDEDINGSPSYPDFVDWQREATSFDGLAFLRGTTITLVDGATDAQQFTTAEVTNDFVRVLGAKAVLGSVAPLADVEGSESIVVLKYDTWVTRFGADSSIVGRTLEFTNGRHRVVGVLEAGVDYPNWAHLYTPLTRARIESDGLEVRDYRLDNRVVGRLHASATREEARAELRTIADRLGVAYPASNADWSVRVIPLEEELVGNVRASLYVLLAGVVGLLAIACANVANLCLARTLARSREMAVRASLGAGRARLIRQLLTESLVLGTVGGVVGVVFAMWGVSLFLGWGIPGLPRTGEIGMDGRVLTFATFVSVGAVAVFGLAPALLGSRSRLMSAIKQHDNTKTSDRLRSMLVGGQVAITVVLLAAAALLAKSFASIQSMDTGFEPEGLVTIRLNLPSEFDGHPKERMALYQRLLDDARAHPAISAATIVNHLPLTGRGVLTPLRVDGIVDDTRLTAWLRLAGPDYFNIVGIPIVSGRAFQEQDHAAWTGAVLINESFARQLFGDNSPIGRRVTVFKQASVDPDYGDALEGQIVGVVGDTRNTLRDLQPTPSIYVPFAVHPWPSAMLAVRPRPGAAVADALRSIVREEDPRIPTLEVAPLTELASYFVGRDRFLTIFAGVFSAVSVLLALIGVYGVVSFAVRRQARELGIRVALGASRRGVIGYVLARSSWMVGIGTAVGLVVSVAVTRFMVSVLFRTSPLDPMAVGSAVVLMAVLGIAAASIPARRAANADPMLALRGDG